MTREEAIKILTEQKNRFLDEYVDYGRVAEAYDMAFAALVESGKEQQESTSDKIILHNDKVIIDGNKLIPQFIYPQKYIVKGDSHSFSIAAASILAKVSRDRYMEKLDMEYPQYKWKDNAGYLTKEHSEAILKYGITPFDRKKFLRNLLSESKQLSLL